MQRILVVGTSGAGKSTFAARLADSMRCPMIELDELVETKGFSGEECRQASRFLEQALGLVVTDRPTAEAHQQSRQQLDATG